jgi:hypothetical protein
VAAIVGVRSQFDHDELDDSPLKIYRHVANASVSG